MFIDADALKTREVLITKSYELLFTKIYMINTLPEDQRFEMYVANLN